MTTFQNTSEQAAVDQFIRGYTFFTDVSMQSRGHTPNVRLFGTLSEFVTAVTTGPFGSAVKKQALKQFKDHRMGGGVTSVIGGRLNEPTVYMHSWGGLSDMVEQGSFVHEGGEAAYLIVRDLADLPENSAVGEFAGHWTTAKVTGKLFGHKVLYGKREVHTTAEYEAVLEELASDLAKQLTVTKPGTPFEVVQSVELTRLGATPYVVYERRFMRPYLQANDMILRLQKTDPITQHRFLRFLAEGHYSPPAEIGAIFDSFSERVH